MKVRITRNTHEGPVSEIKDLDVPFLPWGGDDEKSYLEGLNLKGRPHDMIRISETTHVFVYEGENEAPVGALLSIEFLVDLTVIYKFVEDDAVITSKRTVESVSSDDVLLFLGVVVSDAPLRPCDIIVKDPLGWFPLDVYFDMLNDNCSEVYITRTLPDGRVQELDFKHGF